jgi:predicted ATPase
MDTMTTARVSKIRIEGLRVFENVELDLTGMTVLIGDNGAGKSTLLEALEILRKAGTSGRFVQEVLNNQHGPFIELLRKGSRELRLGVVVEGGGPTLDYSFTASLSGTVGVITHERLEVYGESASDRREMLLRGPDSTRWFDQGTGAYLENSSDPTGLAAESAAHGLRAQAPFIRLSKALQNIEYHPPFDVRPIWQQLELEVRRGPRWPSSASHTERVRRYGQDLPTALLIIRNDKETWQRFIGRSRAAVGIDLQDMSIDPAGAGNLDVTLKFQSPRPAIPLRSLSEGQLSYLIMLATIELGTNRSVLALDEPDIHCHPELVVNLIQLLEDVSRVCPVVIATHSDRLLDALESPAESVVLCETQPNGSSTLRRPNPIELKRWLKKYGGLGSIRAKGFGAYVFDDTPKRRKGK